MTTRRLREFLGHSHDTLGHLRDALNNFTDTDTIGGNVRIIKALKPPNITVLPSGLPYLSDIIKCLCQALQEPRDFLLNL